MTPELVRPHAKALDITHINFKNIKDMGMKKLIFSQANTLTKGSNYFIDENVAEFY